MTYTFTARNSKHLEAQIDEANAALIAAGQERLVLGWGEAHSGGPHRWFVNGEYGAVLKDRLTFVGLVAEIQRRFDNADACAEMMAD